MVEAITLKQSSQAVSLNIIQLLTRIGLQVMQSFNLNDIKTLNSAYQCPYHQNVPCDCEYKVLLVYRPNTPAPVTLLISGHSDYCSIHMVEQANNHVFSQEVKKILELLVDSNPNLLT